MTASHQLAYKLFVVCFYMTHYKQKKSFDVNAKQCCWIFKTTTFFRFDSCKILSFRSHLILLKILFACGILTALTLWQYNQTKPNEIKSKATSTRCSLFRIAQSNLTSRCCCYFSGFLFSASSSSLAWNSSSLPLLCIAFGASLLLFFFIPFSSSHSFANWLHLKCIYVRI